MIRPAHPRTMIVYRAFVFGLVEIRAGVSICAMLENMQVRILRVRTGSVMAHLLRLQHYCEPLSHPATHCFAERKCIEAVAIELEHRERTVEHQFNLSRWHFLQQLVIFFQLHAPTECITDERNKTHQHKKPVDDREPRLSYA
jgi:hypothetical protein